MSSTTETTDVAIVGAGPSGLLAALLLARLDVRSIVVERNPKTDTHPKAHELNTRSIEILRDAGISEDELAEEASPLEDASRIQFCRTINEELGHIDLLDDPARREKYEKHLQQTLPYLNLSQSEFEKILVRHTEASPLIDLRFGHKWESLKQEDDGVVSVIAADGNTYEARSTYLLGCDGASSRVRKACDIEMSGPTNIQSFVNAYFEADLREYVDTPAKLYWILHPEYAGTLVAHHGAKRWVYAAPVNGPWETPEDFTEDVFLDRMRGALGRDIPGLTVTSISTWHMTAQIAERYREARVLLVGDAAHRFPPTGGLGMNTGIADAHNLCWKLARVIQGQGHDSLLNTYEEERKPIAEHNCAESLENFHKIFEVIEALGLNEQGLRQFTWLMKGSPVKWFPGPVRKAIGWLAIRIPIALVGRGLREGRVRRRVQAAIADQTNHFDRLGLDIGYVYKKGALIDDGQPAPNPENPVAEYVPSCQSGARLPHCWEVSGDGTRSSHKHVEYDRFCLFAPETVIAEQISETPSGLSVVDSTMYPADCIPHDRIILVRPDGHVAWNIAADEFSREELSSVMLNIVCPISSVENGQKLQGSV